MPPRFLNGNAVSATNAPNEEDSLISGKTLLLPSTKVSEENPRPAQLNAREKLCSFLSINCNKSQLLTPLPQPSLDRFTLRNSLRGKPLSTLLEKLACEDASTRSRAAEAIGLLHKSSESAIPALVRALEDSESSVRYFAAQALGNIHGADWGVIEALECIARQESSENPSSPAYAAARSIRKIQLRRESPR